MSENRTGWVGDHNPFGDNQIVQRQSKVKRAVELIKERMRQQTSEDRQLFAENVGRYGIGDEELRLIDEVLMIAGMK